MGASSSKKEISQEQQELESIATSTGFLPTLEKVFSKLADPQTKSIPLKSLQECLSLDLGDPISETFSILLPHLGPSIVDVFFMGDKEGVDWIQFLRGYMKCCGRMPASMSLNKLYKLYVATCSKAGLASKLELEFESDDTDKVSGYFTSTDVVMFLWICWAMSQNAIMNKLSLWEEKLEILDMNPLALSAVTSCTDDVKELNIWDCCVSGLNVQLPAQKLHMWVLSTVPSLAHCFKEYVDARFQKCAALEDNLEPSSLPNSMCFSEPHNKHLLTCGTAWAISLTLKSTLCNELLKMCIPRNNDGTFHNLLYRSSLHGRGLSRFWSHVEGYHGPSLILVSATSGNIQESDSAVRRWVIGILTEQGFENKDVFYGSSGSLYSISPIFHVFSPHGKEKNFVYSHLHTTGRVYEPHPKPVGLGFGGSAGNERISIDEDFARVTIRHHAVDKTYRPGSLVSNQGFLPLEASVLEVEVWGLGGEVAKKEQSSHKNREQLFTEQRRKVDLKTFGNWEDSPEKLMMDMVSDPNRVEREDR